MQGGKIFSTSLEEEEEKKEKEEEKNCSTTYLTEVPGLERGILTHANKSEEPTLPALHCYCFYEVVDRTIPVIRY